jgi:hypothetical protein
MHLRCLELLKGPHGVTRSNHHGFEPTGKKIGPSNGYLKWGSVKVIKARLFDSFVGNNETNMR